MSMCPVGFCVTKQPLQDSTAFPTQLGIGLEKVSQTKPSLRSWLAACG